MIETSTLWLRSAACLYALGLLHSLLAIARKNQKLYPVALGSFRIAVVLHFVALVEISLAYGRLPLDSVFEALSLCAFLIAVVFLMVEWRYHFASTAVALFPLVFLMTLVASMERPVASWPNVGVRDAWLIVHIVLVLAGFAGAAADRSRVHFLLDPGAPAEIQESRKAARKTAAAGDAG